MRYHELIEAQIPDARSLGVITIGPEYYLHTTHTPAQVRSIVANGFDLKKFGLTARKLNMEEFAAKDPRGVFATAHNPERALPEGKPYIVFKIDPRPRVLSRPDARYGQTDGYGADLKTELFDLFGFAGQKLTKILISQGIDAIQSTGEYIILNPANIVIVGSSIPGLVS
jgi:hypothetical protein